MTGELLVGLTVVSALGCGLMAGVFFAFSAFVMTALARLPPAQGLAAMQAINVAVLNRSFLGAFLGTAAACALLVVSSLSTWHAPDAGYRLVGGALYLIGSLAVTIVCNVPRNEALAAVAADSAAGPLDDHRVRRSDDWCSTATSPAAAVTFISGTKWP